MFTLMKADPSFIARPLRVCQGSGTGWQGKKGWQHWVYIYMPVALEHGHNTDGWAISVKCSFRQGCWSCLFWRMLNSVNIPVAEFLLRFESFSVFIHFHPPLPLSLSWESDPVMEMWYCFQEFMILSLLSDGGQANPPTGYTCVHLPPYPLQPHSVSDTYCFR